MNYNTLRNKPTINHKELIGNNKASDIGGMTEEDMQELLKTDLTPYYSKDEIDDLFSRSFVYREKSGSIVTFDCPSTSQSIPEVTVGVEATQSGSGDPSPTNIRPISGWTACNVTRTGKNLLNPTIQKYSNPFVVYGGTIASNVPDGSLVFKAGTYTISINENVPTIEVRDNPNSIIKTGQGNSLTFTLEEEKAIKIAINKGSAADIDSLTFQIEKGSTATTYEAYNGQTYTTALKDENDQPLTCYGGQLENVNGVQTLTVTHANISSYNGETINEPWISSMDVYSEGATPTTGAQVVYPLTTPTKITQSTQAISTQDGVNNLWVDSGDIEVKCLDRIIPAGE